MTALRRAFIAVVPPSDALDSTDALVEIVRVPDDGLRWSRREQRHVTLQFLGAVPDTEELVAALESTVADVAPFTLALGGAGAFPSARRASVLWLGIREGADDLGALATTVVAATTPFGVAVDDRPYHPHFTLARSAPARDLRAVVEHLGTGPPGPPWTVDELVLFDSDTRPEGAVHAVHARVPLRGPKR